MLQKRAQSLPWHPEIPGLELDYGEEMEFSLVLYRAYIAMTHQAFPAAVDGAAEEMRPGTHGARQLAGQRHAIYDPTPETLQVWMLSV